jgi:hypothetical protein
MTPATKASSARLNPMASVHSAPGWSKRSSRMRAIPGQTSRNQKTISGRTGAAASKKLTAATASAEAKKTISQRIATQAGSGRVSQAELRRIRRV